MARPSAPRQERPKRWEPTKRGSEQPVAPSDDEEVPTLAKLAAMLAGK